MDIQKLFHMQTQLDNHIEQEKKLQNENLIDRKLLALLVEMGELANETRCFKFWSSKPPAPFEKISEEYVDGLHFILSLGIEFGFQDIYIEEKQSNSDVISQFLRIYGLIQQLQLERSMDAYTNLFKEYIQLGWLIGITSEQIETAYIMKNEVNYQRQEQGY